MANGTVPTHLISPISPVGGGAAGTGNSARDRLPDVVTPPHVHALQANQTSQALSSRTTRSARAILTITASRRSARRSPAGSSWTLPADGSGPVAQEQPTTRSILVPPSAAVERKHSFSHVSAPPTLEAIQMRHLRAFPRVSRYTPSAVIVETTDRLSSEWSLGAEHGVSQQCCSPEPQSWQARRHMSPQTTPRTPPATTQAHFQPSPASPSSDCHTGLAGSTAAGRLPAFPRRPRRARMARRSEPRVRSGACSSITVTKMTTTRTSARTVTLMIAGQEGLRRLAAVWARLQVQAGEATVPCAAGPCVMARSPPRAAQPHPFAVENGDSPSPKARPESWRLPMRMMTTTTGRWRSTRRTDEAGRQLVRRRQPTVAGVAGEVSPAPAPAPSSPSSPVAQSHRGPPTVLS